MGVCGDPWFSFWCVIVSDQVDFGQELVEMFLVVAQWANLFSLVGHGFCLLVTRLGKMMTHMKTLVRHCVFLVVGQVFRGQNLLPQRSSLLLGRSVRQIQCLQGVGFFVLQFLILAENAIVHKLVSQSQNLGHRPFWILD